ncbi:MAG: AMIN domain-containing protein [Deltaproteobacteria bacterium]|nr:MAG: AMIN domain-containing protein [Deltaproteobacteria bacterium]
MQIRVLALVALPAAAGLSAGAGRLLAVRPAGDAQASVIELVGDRPLSFTTLRLLSPPRVVIDVADADASGVAGAQVVDDGTVRRVGVASVGTTARVVIELAGDTEFDVGAVGTVVQVRVARLAPLVARAEPPPPARPPVEVPPPAVRPDGPPARVAEPPPERRVALQEAQQPSRPPATLQAAPPAPAPAEPRQATPVAIAAAPTVVIPPPSAAAAPVVVAQVSPPPEKPAAETPPAASASRARPPEVAATPPPEVAATPPPEVAKPPPEVRAEGGASREEVERARASIPTVSIVASPPPAAAPAPATAAARPAPARTRASITGIGFRPSAGGIVLVRSDRPLDYAVTGADRVVVVHLRGAGIPLPTNRLPLDTRFFDTPVVRVVPEPVPGGVDLRIELRGLARYELSQSPGVLTIAFERS